MHVTAVLFFVSIGSIFVSVSCLEISQCASLWGDGRGASRAERLLDTSDGIRTLDESREYNVDARFVDGTDAIKAAAAGKVALWNSGV